MSGTIRMVAKFGARDVIRSRWLAAYTLFFAVTTWGLLRFSDTEVKALLALTNIVLFIVPLASIVFGVMYLYGSREFVELLLAQPVERRGLFAGLYLGLAGPVGLAAVAGIAGPLLLHGASGAALRAGLVLTAMTVVLGAIFTGLATIIAYRVDDRVRGLATALGVWLLMAAVYDGLVLMAISQFGDYPLERPMLAAMIANPIDLARVVLLLQFDVAALLGYTGAVFQRFFAGAVGLVVASLALAIWTGLPVLIGGRLFRTKDF